MYATLPGGYLRRFVQAWPSAPIFIVWNNAQLMGWGFILRVSNSRRISLYVNPRYRNRGVAKALVTNVLMYYAAITMTAWDEVTWHLFRKIQRRYSGRISILDWHKHKPWYDALLERLGV